MEAHVTGTSRSPAQLYALIFGAVLTIVGVIGFFYNSDFTSNEAVRGSAFGVLDVNGWHNTLHILTGVIGLIVAASYSNARVYAFLLGAAYVVVAIWGFIAGDHSSILSIIPVNSADDVLHLFLGVLGIVAGMATPAVPDAPTRPAAS